MAHGRLDAERIITHTLPLEEAERGINLSAEQKALKVMLVTG
jgi:threonine dehydrogenase-like Zn-dependent dehydrogenase